MGNILSWAKLNYFNIVQILFIHYQDAVFVYTKSNVYVLSIRISLAIPLGKHIVLMQIHPQPSTFGSFARILYRRIINSRHPLCQQTHCHNSIF